MSGVLGHCLEFNGSVILLVLNVSSAEESYD